VVVRAALELPDGRGLNLFRVPTLALEERIGELPAVRSAEVRAILPDTLLIRLVEREAVVVWASAAGAWLVDDEGRLFATATIDPDGSLPAPLVTDRRTEATSGTGARLDPTDLAIVRSLGALTPAMLGSRAPALALSIEETDGWVLEVPGAWHAVFGVYTPTARPVGLIPAQVRCLAGLVAGREEALERIVLAPGAQTCGTYVPGAPARPGRPGREAASPAPAP